MTFLQKETFDHFYFFFIFKVTENILQERIASPSIFTKK